MSYVKRRFVNFAGCWLAQKKDKNGQNYFQGTVREDMTIHGGDKLMIFKNVHKKNANSPDVNVVLAVVDEGQDTVVQPRQEDTPTTQDSQEMFDHPIDDPVAPEGGDESAPF